MRFLLILLVIFSVSATAFAQTKKIRWTYDLCEFEGTYDSVKYSEAKLRNTLSLINNGGFTIETDATPFSIADVKKLNVAALDREYALKSARLKNLAVVDSAYFESLRQKRLKELEQVYRLSKITMLAHAAPVKLRDYTAADSCVESYAEPLINGGGELLGAWRRVNEKARQNNADPAHVKSIFDRRYNSPEKYDYARIEVMTFGWWNCANQFIEYVEQDGKERKNFERLFRRVRKIECDEP